MANAGSPSNPTSRLIGRPMSNSGRSGGGTFTPSRPAAPMYLGEVARVDYSTGTVTFRAGKQHNNIPIESLNTSAIPLIGNLSLYPVVGELILIIELGKQYYLPVNLLNQISSNRSIPIFSDKTDQQKSDDNIVLPQTFDINTNAPGSAILEGEIALVGRFGQSIKFGSTIKDSNGNPILNYSISEKSKNGDPITIIRNGASFQSTGVVTTNTTPSAVTTKPINTKKITTRPGMVVLSTAIDSGTYPNIGLSNRKSIGDNQIPEQLLADMQKALELAGAKLQLNIKLTVNYAKSNHPSAHNGKNSYHKTGQALDFSTINIGNGAWNQADTKNPDYSKAQTAADTIVAELERMGYSRNTERDGKKKSILWKMGDGSHYDHFHMSYRLIKPEVIDEPVEEPVTSDNLSTNVNTSNTQVTAVSGYEEDIIRDACSIYLCSTQRILIDNNVNGFEGVTDAWSTINVNSLDYTADVFEPNGAFSLEVQTSTIPSNQRAADPAVTDQATGIKRAYTTTGGSSSNFKNFFDAVLAGESKTYNDHNWYLHSGKKGLRGYIEGRSKNRYSALTKPLSEYTIGEIKAFQSRKRDGVTGQLWATGRYQIIPGTLKGVTKDAGVSDSEIYSMDVQDKLAWQLLLERRAIKNYLKKIVPDTEQNLQAAALQMACIWSSIGVPYKTQGRHKIVDKDQSYYAGGGDRASVSSATVMAKLREFRDKGV